QASAQMDTHSRREITGLRSVRAARRVSSEAPGTTHRCEILIGRAGSHAYDFLEVEGAVPFLSKEVSVLRMKSGKSVRAAGTIGLVASFFWGAAFAAPLPDPAPDVPKAAAKGK